MPQHSQNQAVSTPCLPSPDCDLVSFKHTNEIPFTTFVCIVNLTSNKALAQGSSF